MRRRPTRSHRVADKRDGRDAGQPAQRADGPDEVARITQMRSGRTWQEGVAHVDEAEGRPGCCPPARSDLTALQTQHLRERRFGHQVAGLLRGEHRGLVDVEPHIQGDRDQPGADQERHPPSPLHERGAVLADGEVHAEEGQAAEHPRGAAAEQGEHAIPAAFAGGAYSALSSADRPIRRRRRILAAPQADQDQRGCNSDRRRAGYQAHGHGRHGHDQQRGDQGLLAAQPVPEVAEDGRAERPGQERRRERPHGGDGGHVGPRRGKNTAGNTSAAAVP